MIVQPPERRRRPSSRSANRELAVGLVLLAGVAGLLATYTLGAVCGDRESWPCRPTRSSQAEPTAVPPPVGPGAGMLAVPPFPSPTFASSGMPSGPLPTQPSLGVFPSATLPVDDAPAQPALTVVPASPTAPVVESTLAARPPIVPTVDRLGGSPTATTELGQPGYPGSGIGSGSSQGAGGGAYP